MSGERRRPPGRPDPREIRSGWDPATGEDVARFAERFRQAIGLALDEGAPSLEIARSRAAVEFRRLARGLSAEQAERERCRVYREECARRGVDPLNGDPFEAEPVEVLEDDDGAGGVPVPRVPRGEPVEGARVRLSGRR